MIFVNLYERVYKHNSIFWIFHEYILKNRWYGLFWLDELRANASLVENEIFF